MFWEGSLNPKLRTRTKAEFIRKNSRGGLGMTVEVLTNMLDSAAELVSRADVDRARRLIFEAEPEMARHGEIGGGHARGDNITSDRGTSAEYLRRRLKRDAPALWEQVASGEKSARSAAIEAGIVKVKTPVEVATASLAKLTNVGSDKPTNRQTDKCWIRQTDKPTS
jgi:hypothetical protein